MSWTLRLPFEILEEFARAHRLPPPKRSRRERLFGFDPRDVDFEAGRRSWKRYRNKVSKKAGDAALKIERVEHRREVERIVATTALGVSRASCVACRREVEVRDGCKTAVAHEPCVVLRPGKKGGRKKRA